MAHRLLCPAQIVSTLWIHLNQAFCFRQQVSAGILNRAWHFHLARIKPDQPFVTPGWLPFLSSLSLTPGICDQVYHLNFIPTHPPLFNAQLDRRLDKGEQGHTWNVKGVSKVKWIISIYPIWFLRTANLIGLFFHLLLNMEEPQDIETVRELAVLIVW